MVAAPAAGPPPPPTPRGQAPAPGTVRTATRKRSLSPAPQAATAMQRQRTDGQGGGWRSLVGPLLEEVNSAGKIALENHFGLLTRHGFTCDINQTLTHRQPVVSVPPDWPSYQDLLPGHHGLGKNDILSTKRLKKYCEECLLIIAGNPTDPKWRLERDART